VCLRPHPQAGTRRENQRKVKRDKLKPYQDLQEALQRLAFEDPDLMYDIGKEANMIVWKAAQKELLLPGQRRN